MRVCVCIGGMIITHPRGHFKMSSILSRAFKRRRRFSSARRTHKMLKIGKNKAATKEVKEFVKWCHRVGIELHPNVSSCQAVFVM